MIVERLKSVGHFLLVVTLIPVSVLLMFACLALIRF